MTKKIERTRFEQGNMSRRDLLKISAAAGAASTVAGIAGVAGVAAVPGVAQAQTTCTGLNAIEAFPTSPLILNPFTDLMPQPQAATPATDAEIATWASQPGSGVGQQDCDGGTHQLYPGTPGTVVANYPSKPIVYKFKLQTRAHSFSSSPVRTLVPYVNANGQVVPAGTVVPKLPDSTIYGFNGTFPGPMVNAEYGKPVLIRFENELDQNPLNLDRGDFGDPNLGFLTHLHNGHTAAESDGNPHHRPEAYNPGQWFDAMYLNYPAGGLESNKQSFLWFHDHREGHTGANVYKGMAGLYPIYDPLRDNGDETNPNGFKFPGVRVNNPDGSFNVKYDLPIALSDFRFDDGAVPHQDFHNGCGESHPEWFGQLYFRHFPNHGFIGDVFAVNGVAYPVLNVFRRKYRLRFLPASISRQWELIFMKSAAGPKSAVSLGYGGDELQGQYRIEDGVQCLKMTEIATGGGVLPRAIVRDSIEHWPAMRHEVVVDFTKYMDGSPTKTGDVIYLTNILKMTDGRVANNSTRRGLDRRYKIPLLKIVIGGLPPEVDRSVMPANGAVLRAQEPVPANWKNAPSRTFELQRGGFGGETQWLINGNPFNEHVPLATVVQGRAEQWTIKNGGGGWEHPMHMHQEEHFIMSRNGKSPSSLPGHQDDGGKDDVIALDGSETVVIYRNFRTFKGKYVAHCHQLAHEDHSMMFGWVIS